MRKYKSIIVFIFLSWASTYGPLNPFLRSFSNQDPPQLILVLGGDIDREIAGMKIAKELSLPVLISGGSNIEYSNWLIENKDIPLHLVSRDSRAIDTFTNFTYIVDDFKNENIILFLQSS